MLERTKKPITEAPLIALQMERRVERANCIVHGAHNPTPRRDPPHHVGIHSRNVLLTQSVISLWNQKSGWLSEWVTLVDIELSSGQLKIENIDNDDTISMDVAATKDTKEANEETEITFKSNQDIKDVDVPEKTEEKALKKWWRLHTVWRI